MADFWLFLNAAIKTEAQEEEEHEGKKSGLHEKKLYDGDRKFSDAEIFIKSLAEFSYEDRLEGILSKVSKCPYVVDSESHYWTLNSTEYF